MSPAVPRPDWVSVESSNLLAVRMVGGEWLDIRFGGPGRPTTEYRYYDVPVDVYRDLLAAGSKGKYHAAHIKGRYQYSRLS